MRAAYVVAVVGVKRGRIGPRQSVPFNRSGLDGLKRPRPFFVEVMTCARCGHEYGRMWSGPVEVVTCCRSIVPRQLPDVRNVAACPLVVDVAV